MDGLMDHLLPLESAERSRRFPSRAGRSWIWRSWRSQLAAMGYERMAQVDGMGQFSIRGGIVDIFPLTEETPIRIELWDDEVDSIRTFDVESQRSVEQLEEVTIYPAAEVVLDQAAALEEGSRPSRRKKKPMRRR